MRNNIAFFLVTFLITSVIIFSWFSTKTIVSNNSEENLDFVNFTRTADHDSTNWYPSGTGYVNVFDHVRYPFFKFLSFFQRAGFAPFLVQAFSYWIIMTLGVIFMYILLYKGFLLNRLTSVIGSYFYLLNIFTMTQVWKRNIYQGMFPWAYLPLYIFLWMKWLNEGKIRWLIIFAISISLFSHAFAHPGYFFVYTATGGIFAFIKFKENWKNKLGLKIFLRCISALFLGALFNIWWIYPLIHNSTAQGATLDVVNDAWKANLESLAGVSQYFGTFDILLLRQKFYFIKSSPLSTQWYWFYSNPLVLIVSIIILLICIFGIIKSKGQKYWTYLISLLIVGWFICKGSNFPFGKTFFQFLFSSFPFTAALRNPYEKFGLVWLLPYSVFFALGLYYLAFSVKLKWRYVFLGSMMVLFCGILVYPMWNGVVFPQRDRLTIPRYYSEANDYLNLNLSKRVFHIPFSIQNEKIEYNWGYLGEDPSGNLFDSQNVSSPKLPVFKNYFELIPKYLSSSYLPRVLGLLGVDHIVLHDDMIYPKLDFTLVKVNNWKEVEEGKNFGQLTLFTLNSDIVKPEIYATNSIVKFDSIEQALNKTSDGEFDTTRKIFITKDINLTTLTETPVNIEYKKTSADYYQVLIRGAKVPFILVLNNTFDKLWQARVEKELIRKHFIANGFANGWMIDKIGDYKVDIYFKIWPWD